MIVNVDGSLGICSTHMLEKSNFFNSSLSVGNSETYSLPPQEKI